MTHSTTAKYVGSTLVASFPNANPPLIWTFDLERNHSYTLTMQEGGGGWELGITSFKGTLEVIARFDRVEDVQEAFLLVQKVLMKGRRSLLGKILLVGLAIIVIPAVLVISALAFEHWKFTHSISSPAVVSAPAEMENGIPLSADDVLKPPR